MAARINMYRDNLFQAARYYPEVTTDADLCKAAEEYAHARTTGRNNRDRWKQKRYRDKLRGGADGEG